MLWIVLFSFMTRDKLLSNYLIARRVQVLLLFSGCAP
jgi:hypothetical protein